MGGAFIGVADDWTAIYWNPAGLARLKHAGLGVSLEVVRVMTHDSQGLANPTVPLTPADEQRGDVFSQFGGEPSQFNGQDSNFRTPLPGVGGYASAGGFTFAGGSYSPLGFAFDVADGKTPGYDVSFKSQGYLINHNLSVARQLLPGLSVGAGVNIVQAKLYRTANKQAPTYDSAVSADASTLGTQGVFGFMADWGTRAHLGGVFRTGQDLKLRGHAFAIDSRFPAEESDFSDVVRNPTTYGLGLSVLPWPTLTLAVDWQRTLWSATRTDIAFDQQGPALHDQTANPGWASTTRYRFGAEWRPWSAWSFRAGYFRDPQAVALGSQALTGIIDPTIRYFTSGLSYHQAHWQLSLTNQYGRGTIVTADRTLRKDVVSWITEWDYFF